MVHGMDELHRARILIKAHGTAEAARLSGLSRRTMYHILAGANVTYATIRAIMTALDVQGEAHDSNRPDTPPSPETAPDAPGGA
jgi:DNA-binding phage protein